MLVIYKYEIPAEGLNSRFIIDMPKGARILSVGAQETYDVTSDKWFQSPFIWALVNPKNEKVPVEFLCLGTGITIEEVVPFPKFIGTIQLKEDTRVEIVLHVFLKDKNVAYIQT